MNLVRRLSLVFVTLLAVSVRVAPLCAQETPPEPPDPTIAFTDAEKAGLKNLDAAIARFDALLGTVKDVHEKAAVKSFLDSLKDRRYRLRPGYDPSIFDNLRLDVEIEYQRLVAWLAPMTPTRANRRDIRIALPAVRETGSGVMANQLSAMEKEAGWQLLFDGKTLGGWRGYRTKGLPKINFGWEVKDDVLHAKPADKTLNLPFATLRTGELITDKKFNDFELKWDWRVSKDANSGIKYLVTEERPSAPGPEYQMFDDLGVKDPNRDHLHDTGGFYGIFSPKLGATKPAGEWNTSRVIVKGNHVEHWLNGQNIMTCELGSPEMKAGVAKSKFKDEPGFGDKINGHVMLTYHGDEAWIRNVKVRELK